MWLTLRETRCQAAVMPFVVGLFGTSLRRTERKRNVLSPPGNMQCPFVNLFEANAGQWAGNTFHYGSCVFVVAHGDGLAPEGFAVPDFVHLVTPMRDRRSCPSPSRRFQGAFVPE